MSEKTGHSLINFGTSASHAGLNTITDRATYQRPMVPSIGMHYVIVNGVILIDQGVQVPTTFPGQALASIH